MRVRVRLFAIARERAGTKEGWVDLPLDATVDEALEELGRCFPKLPPVLMRAMIAVNREYVQRSHRLKDGDEMAVIPPVSGGQDVVLHLSPRSNRITGNNVSREAGRSASSGQGAALHPTRRRNAPIQCNPCLRQAGYKAAPRYGGAA
ncbi:MAG: MoaD/ThiS family protein [Dehalococcoidia bacterium]|nr:MoaD/ThiS family protein [Dehalococcoidia bacterium]